jgi:hypothetical protein
VEASLVVILIGVLLFVSQLGAVPPPRWMSASAGRDDKSRPA